MSEIFTCDACKQVFVVSPVVRQIPITVRGSEDESRKLVCSRCAKIIRDYVEATPQ